MNWMLTKDLSNDSRHDGNYLLHGPALVHLDFNPEGVERGYWQDGAMPGTAQNGSGHVPYYESTGEPCNDSGPGAWCVPGWECNGDTFFTRFLSDEQITHCVGVPSGPHSHKMFEENYRP